jgi:hypothetical protein
VIIALTLPIFALLFVAYLGIRLAWRWLCRSARRVADSMRSNISA